jgi:hypothetical protein
MSNVVSRVSNVLFMSVKNVTSFYLACIESTFSTVHNIFMGPVFPEFVERDFVPFVPLLVTPTQVTEDGLELFPKLALNHDGMLNYLSSRFCRLTRDTKYLCVINWLYYLPM